MSLRDRLLARLYPHEWIALVFVVAGVIRLEMLPVTYPRSALFLAYFVPVGLMVAIALVTLFVVRKRSSSNENRERLRLIVRSLFLLGTVMPVHFLLKSFIYLINPRVWDSSLLEIDRWLLLGHSPSVFLVQLFQSPVFLGVIDFIYSGLYYFLLVGHVGILMVILPRRFRVAFIAAYSTMWIVGSVLYILLPSWGPVFFWPDPFEESLISMPRTMSVQYVLYQEISSLVQNPLGTRIVRFGCVAAFPSLHLAVVTLFALASRVVSRVWFRLNVLLTVLMLIGSVVSGYHYLIDSLAGILIGAGLWFGWCHVYRPETGEQSTER